MPAAREVAAKLHRVLLCRTMSEEDGVADVVEVVECGAPQQKNGYDCGVFALGFAEALFDSDDYGFVREQHEGLLRVEFNERGGQEGFASGLRKRIGDDVRELAREGDAKKGGDR